MHKPSQLDHFTPLAAHWQAPGVFCRGPMAVAATRRSAPACLSHTGWLTVDNVYTTGIWPQDRVTLEARELTIKSERLWGSFLGYFSWICSWFVKTLLMFLPWQEMDNWVNCEPSNWCCEPAFSWVTHRLLKTVQALLWTHPLYQSCNSLRFHVSGV